MKTAKDIREMKGKEKIVMLTAYDFSLAKLMDGLVEVILVGDSLGMVVLGHKDTRKVTMADMLRSISAVAKGAVNTLIVGDMPIGAYQNRREALKNARLLLQAGAQAVKIEKMPHIAKYLFDNGIAVMGHIGLTPQTVKDYKVQGRDEESAANLQREAKLLDKSGCFVLVLECIPKQLAKKISENISIPTIGIGAGAYCDGQVLVSLDMLGFFTNFKPKFVKRYVNASEIFRKAFVKFSKEVKEGVFPDDRYSYH